MPVNDRHLIWIDLEMTGLKPEHHRIIEIATLITDSELNLLAEGPVFAIYQPDAELAKMDAWCVEQHGRSGLTQRVRESAVSEAQAEADTLAFLAQWVGPGISPMCGNTICQDRRFLARHMPLLERYFHYRHIDVSTVKELCQRWAPAAAHGFSKTSSHLAMDDIRDSVAELRHYRQTFIRLPGESNGEA